MGAGWQVRPKDQLRDHHSPPPRGAYATIFEMCLGGLPTHQGLAIPVLWPSGAEERKGCHAGPVPGPLRPYLPLPLRRCHPQADKCAGKGAGRPARLVAIPADEGLTPTPNPPLHSRPAARAARPRAPASASTPPPACSGCRRRSFVPSPACPPLLSYPGEGRQDFPLPGSQTRLPQGQSRPFVTAHVSPRSCVSPFSIR